MEQQTKWSQFGILISVFFFWGFVAASNDILIPVFKEHLNLSQAQSQLVSLAFYISYTVGSIIYFLVSRFMGQDILNKLGYKNSISLGLVASALGTLLFYPAAETGSFYIMISGLFIVGLGFSLQQIAANPLTIVMGDPKKGAQRLSMAGGINNLGTTIGPILVSMAIFGVNSANKPQEMDIEGIKIPYLILGGAFLLAAIMFKFSSIPNKINLVAPISDKVNIKTEKKNVFQYPQLILGMIAIFVYVGVEVSTAGNLSEFIKTHTTISLNQTASFISLYWGSLMIGRWTSSVGLFGLKGIPDKLMCMVMPYIAFGIFLLINKITGHEISIFYPYTMVILVLVFANLASRDNPVQQLLIFSILAIVALLIGVFSNGLVSLYAFISVGLFCSTLWPCIFTLSIAGLGKYTGEGSSFLIMMIMGGGWISLLQGYLAEDNLLGIQLSYFVGVFCFLYLIYFAIASKKILINQGIDYEKI